MELLDALRTTGAVRDFRPDPVPDDVLYRVLDTARFAPSGGNQQGWHLVVVRDPDKKRAVRDLYLPGWYEYVGMTMAGLRPWAPTNDRDAEAATTPAPPGDGFAEHLDEVPLLLALFVDLSVLAAVDRDADRYSFAGGASLYPFAWNLLLAGRAEGLGGVITTMCIRRENEMKALLGAPDKFALAAVIAMGYPTKEFRRLKRAAVEDFATVDAFNGARLRLSHA
ncbi:MAG TPA: nitroreductase family protein [Acidimicrobiales bacterium]|nr:nitroreductase family protein [Acidimicrobiales bacterium]